ncbi:hypothetical protein MKZ38_008477 [Zalerion maritima]|uniref:Uncharacterized protein n=1 Tax=Zalerion maritima TaxID=339359 RepID=A0AAD5S2F4_9PEZI|nr:hypothetical protein MKZ38_008477 [Zalerion maritima]
MPATKAQKRRARYLLEFHKFVRPVLDTEDLAFVQQITTNLQPEEERWPLQWATDKKGLNAAIRAIKDLRRTSTFEEPSSVFITNGAASGETLTLKEPSPV